MTQLETILKNEKMAKGDKKMNEFEKLKMEREALREQQQNENAEARRKYLAGLEAAKAERQAERDAEIDTALAPEKMRLQNQWLADNPGKTESDFNGLAWKYLRQNLVEMDKNEAFQAELRRQMASGRYHS